MDKTYFHADQTLKGYFITTQNNQWTKIMPKPTISVRITVFDSLGFFTLNS